MKKSQQLTNTLRSTGNSSSQGALKSQYHAFLKNKNEGGHGLKMSGTGNICDQINNSYYYYSNNVS
jgi:hypothetical protein